MLFTAALSQMAYLFFLVVIGYILVRLRCIPEQSAAVLSRLENNVFIPALVLETFMSHFTPAKLHSAGGLLAGSLLLELMIIPISLLFVKLCAKDRYTQNIFWYGLCFSNFGFMGNAVVQALFADVFLEYIIFTLVLWIIIYLWGVPSLLMGDHQRVGWRDKLKNFVNPMFICMLIGMAIGIFGMSVPSFFNTLVSSAAGCMSPIAMLLNGMTIAEIDLRSVLQMRSVYIITILRLLAYPLLFLTIVLPFADALSDTFVICAVCSLAMPLGLNTIVIPSAYGKDVKVASCMALISHLLSCFTIPIVFLVLELILQK